MVCPHLLARRELSQALTAGVALAACGGGGPGGDGSSGADASDARAGEGGLCAPQPLVLGPLGNFPVGSWTMSRADPNNPVVVGHDAQGLFVFTAICPHDFCEVDPPAADGQTVCRCHDSYFDGNGALLRGPSPRGLDHLAASACNGVLTVDLNRVVPAATRTPS